MKLCLNDGFRNACLHNCVEVAKFLLQYKPTIDDPRGEILRTVATQGGVEIVRLLVQNFQHGFLYRTFKEVLGYIEQTSFFVTPREKYIEIARILFPYTQKMRNYQFYWTENPEVAEILLCIPNLSTFFGSIATEKYFDPSSLETPSFIQTDNKRSYREAQRVQFTNGRLRFTYN